MKGGETEKSGAVRGTQRQKRRETETKEEPHLFTDSTFIEHLAIAGAAKGTDQRRWTQMAGTETQQ